MANEKRLVDLYEFLEECDRLLKNPPFVHPATPWDRGLMIAVETALSLPTVDAVEVVWMPVLGFEGLYEISNLGKVRNHKGETLKQGIKRTNCTCYKLVNLWKNGRYYKKYVHRLIAEAFIPNPDNLPMVNHKDEDGTNNSIDNLEWCTREYNVNYGTAKERKAKKIRGVKHTAEHNKKISESMKRHFAKMDGGNDDAER